jgi:hypothetical protein
MRERTKPIKPVHRKAEKPSRRGTGDADYLRELRRENAALLRDERDRRAREQASFWGRLLSRIAVP